MKKEDQDIKEKLLRSAYELFITRGYAVGISKIVKAAGVSKGAMYHYFENKDDLFEAAVNKYVINNVGDYSFVNDERLSLKEKINGIIKVYFYKLYDENSPGIKKGYLKSNMFHLLAAYEDKPKIREAYMRDLSLLKNAFSNLLYSEGVKDEKKNDIFSQILTDILKGHIIDFVFNNEKTVKEINKEITDLVYTNFKCLINEE